VFLVALAGIFGCGGSAPSPSSGSAQVKAMLSDFKNKKSKAWKKVGRNYVFDMQRHVNENSVAPK
jgi:hypothetical protein